MLSRRWKPNPRRPRLHQQKSDSEGIFNKLPKSPKQELHLTSNNPVLNWMVVTGASILALSLCGALTRATFYSGPVGEHFSLQRSRRSKPSSPPTG
jgi:hypothetical protein